MEEKYKKFYQNFHKALQDKISNYFFVQVSDRRMKMSKCFYISVISMLFMVPLPVHSETFFLSCVNNKSNRFTIYYEVNTYSKTIFHISSFNPQNNEGFRVNDYLDIIKWDDPFVYAYRISSQETPVFYVFNLDERTVSSAGHYKSIEPYPQFFECSRS